MFNTFPDLRLFDVIEADKPTNPCVFPAGGGQVDTRIWCRCDCVNANHYLGAISLSLNRSFLSAKCISFGANLPPKSFSEMAPWP